MSNKGLTRYFITGGAGFIGSHVVDWLTGSGDILQVRFDIIKMKKTLGWKQPSLRTLHLLSFCPFDLLSF